MGIFNTKVVGVRQRNQDGIDRQRVIASKVFKGQSLILNREPDNPHDTNAISVWIAVKPWLRKVRTYQIGYISADVASRLAEDIDNGYDVEAIVKDITGGGAGKSLGVNITIDV